MIDLLILGAIALFVLGRLYMALGRDNGPPEGRTRTRQPTPQTPGMARPGLATGPTQRPAAAAADGTPRFTGPAAAGLEEIYLQDRSFRPDEFVGGARAAYEMIVNAFAEGDKATLQPLLDDEVFEAWSAAIDARTDDGDRPPSLLRIKTAAIEEAELVDDLARVDVLFEAELSDGDHYRNAKEVWSFERPVKSADPNWKLAAVSAPD